MVYVISSDGEPLMPCTSVIARLLLKDNKAKVVKRIPFTIKLKVKTTNYTQHTILGIDTGSSKVGSAVVSNSKVLYMSEVEIRNDITKKMDKRRMYRRNRRNRKTRYRKARWLNRKNSIKKDRFSPTMVSKINSHLKEIKFVKSILPVNELILETGTFDPHALKNPNVLKDKSLYQKGINYGFANTRAYILNRDKYICQHCKGKSKNDRLEVHHIIFRSDDGGDEPENLITLCGSCHIKLHNGAIKLKVKGKKKGGLNHATQMNSIRIQLLKVLSEAKETFGYITKEHRYIMGLPKEHYYDAVAIASEGNNVEFKNNSVLIKKCIPKGDYQQTKGVRSEQGIPTGKIHGIRKFDKIKYLGNEYFVKGRMSSGYAILMNIYGEKIDFSNAPKGMKTPKLVNCKRLEARKTWIMKQVAIHPPL